MRAVLGSSSASKTHSKVWTQQTPSAPPGSPLRVVAIEDEAVAADDVGLLELALVPEAAHHDDHPRRDEGAHQNEAGDADAHEIPQVRALEAPAEGKEGNDSDATYAGGCLLAALCAEWRRMRIAACVPLSHVVDEPLAVVRALRRELVHPDAAEELEGRRAHGGEQEEDLRRMRERGHSLMQDVRTALPGCCRVRVC